jgi:hypothetical protein
MTFFFIIGQTIQSIPMNVSIGPIIFLAVFFLVPCLSIGYGFYRLQEYLIKPKKN